MDDKKAIEILEEIIDNGWLISDLEKCVAIDACEMAIEAIKQRTKWIPVAERLPKERTSYLTTFKKTDSGFQLVPRVAVYIGNGERENKWRIIDNGGLTSSEYQDYQDLLECIAWMPLPEPYKPESEVKNNG